MAEEEKIKYYADYLEEAKKLLGEENLEERVKKSAKFGREYYSNLPMVEHSLRETFVKDLDFKNIGDLQGKIHDEVKKKKRILTDLETEEFMKDVLEEILPKVKYGTPDREHNLTNFMGYATLLGEEGQKLFGAIKESIKKGDGRKAINYIIDMMVELTNHRAHDHINQYLLPTDHYELRSKMSEYITKNANKAIEGTGKIQQGLVTKNIDSAFREYVNNQYNKMNEKYGPTDHTKEKVEN